METMKIKLMNCPRREARNKITQNCHHQSQSQNWKNAQLATLYREHMDHGFIIKNELETFLLYTNPNKAF